MLKQFLFLFFIIFQIICANNSLQKNSVYNPNHNIKNWVMSEKLDGIRAYWNGKSLTTKQGNLIYAPSWFIDALPSFALDGELWNKRENFENIQSIVLDHTPTKRWSEIGYYIFEVPNANGDFHARLSKIKNWLKYNKISHIHIIKQIKISDNKDIQTFLKKIVDKNGEGIMLKNPKLPFSKLKKNDLLKLKLANDMEGKIVAINPGKGKFKGLMGSLTIELKNGVTFKLGTGFNLKNRKNPPQIGTIITFKYYGFTKNKKPKFPSFLRIRKSLN